jgi:ubiquitin-protein ligase
MTSDTDQLAVDFEEVKNTLELYPSIEIIQVEGDPPDCYEIEYQLKGYVRDNDGSIRQGSQHRIRVSLPFGYPHFPPTVKPLPSIFHPDIDPDAVRIADYWQKNPSLP